jgi:hypothetical protein
METDPLETLRETYRGVDDQAIEGYRKATAAFSDDEVRAGVRELVRSYAGPWAPYADRLRRACVDAKPGLSRRERRDASRAPRGFVWEETPDGLRRVPMDGADGQPLNFGSPSDRWGAPEPEPLEGAAERLRALTAFLRCGTAIPEELR